MISRGSNLLKLIKIIELITCSIRGGLGQESPLSGKTRNFVKPAQPWGEEEERVLKLEAERAGAARAVLPCSEVHSARPGARCGAQTRMRGGATPS